MGRFCRRPRGAGGLVAALALACAEAASVSPSDTPAPLVHLTDSLAREHFGGIDYIRQQEPSTLDLLIRDPHRCEDASYDPSRDRKSVV